MSDITIHTDGEPNQRHYVSNCAFLNQLSRGSGEIRRQIAAAADANRMRDENRYHLARQRDVATASLLDTLARLLVARPDEAVAVAVFWTTNEKIWLVAAINSGEDTDCIVPADPEILTPNFREWQCQRVEKHANTILQFSRDYLLAPKGDAREEILRKFRFAQMDYSLAKISAFFDRIRVILDGLRVIEKHFFTPKYLEEPSEEEVEYFVDELHEWDIVKDECLPHKLGDIYLNSEYTSQFVREKLESGNDLGLEKLTSENLYIWHELFMCTFENAIICLKRCHEIKSEGDESRYHDVMRVLCIYLEYIVAFTHNSNLFRQYVGLITKLAAKREAYTKHQTGFPTLERVHVLDDANSRGKNETWDGRKGKAGNIGSKTRHVLRKFFSAPKLMLSTFSQKLGVHANANTDGKRKPSRSGHRTEKAGQKLKTQNGFFWSCYLLAAMYQSPENFLDGVVKQERSVRKQITLEVIRLGGNIPSTCRGEKLEYSLYRFLYLGYLSPVEISIRVQKFLRLLHTVIPDPQACQHLLSTLNSNNPVITPVYHAEVILLAGFGSCRALPCPYIGISRPPCAICEYIILQQKKIDCRDGSGKVYPVPLPDGISMKNRRSTVDSIQILTAKVIEDIRAWQMEQEQ
ncbi:hypothetical protein TWF730_011196 [Orbilia blumenaviensis]|uniref:Uncharacterized protein n=1 Tax=Orbilia blumenaviensis TaxID=1796055 RepID=A0AAV9ULZ5_9PEZI